MNSKISKSLVIALLFFAIGLIRVFENELFYDPFIKFYKEIHLMKSSPDFDFPKILLHSFFRYFLNTILSIGILYIAFRKKEIIRFSIVFYSIAFIVLISLYTVVIINLNEQLYQVLFYIRRFLIQPIFILLLLPAFYYQRTIKNKD